MPRAELEKFEQAENEEVQRQILERFAQDLPVTNRTVTGCEYETPMCSVVLAVCCKVSENIVLFLNIT